MSQNLSLETPVSGEIVKRTGELLRFDQLFECPICWELASTMGNLPCGHMICDECFIRERDIQNENKGKRKKFKCPRCVTFVDIRPVKGLPRNRIVAEFNTSFASMSNMCDVLFHYLPITLHCLTCNDKICLICFENNHVGHKIVHLYPEDDQSSSTSLPKGFVQVTEDENVESNEEVELEEELEAVTGDEKDIEVVSEKDNIDEEQLWNDHFDQLCRITKSFESQNRGSHSFNYSEVERQYSEQFYLFNGNRTNLTTWVNEQRNLFREKKLSADRLYKFLELVEKGAWQWVAKSEQSCDNVKRSKKRAKKKRTLLRKGVVYANRSVLSDGDSGSSSSSSASVAEDTLRSLSQNNVQISRKRKKHPENSDENDDDQNGEANQHTSDRNVRIGRKRKFISYREAEHSDICDEDECQNNRNVGRRWRVGSDLLEVEENEILASQSSQDVARSSFVPGKTDEKYFVYDSHHWKMMWFQLSMYGRYHDNCYDVPLEEQGVSDIPPPAASSQVSDKPMSLGMWLACLKERFLRQELCASAAAKVADLVKSGTLTFVQKPAKFVSNRSEQELDGSESIDLTKRSVPPSESFAESTSLLDQGQGERQTEIITAPATSEFEEMQSHSPATYPEEKDVDGDELEFSVPQQTFPVETGNAAPLSGVEIEPLFVTSARSHQNNEKAKFKQKFVRLPLCRGDGVLFRYKSRRDSVFYVGLGVVDRVHLARSAVRILPFKYFAEKDDKYRKRYGGSNFHTQRLSCLYKKWKVKPGNIVEVSTEAVISNQIQFATKGYLKKESIELSKLIVGGIEFEDENPS